MMMHKGGNWIGIATVGIWSMSMLLAVPANGQAGADLFTELFGPEIKRVATTADPADDLVLARHMLEAARSAGDDPALRIKLAEAAYKLAGDVPEGMDTALQAMRLIEQTPPDKRPQRLAAIADLLQKKLTAAKGVDKKPIAGELIDTLLNLADAKAAEGDYPAVARVLARAARTASTDQPQWSSVIAARREHLRLAQAYHRHQQQLANEVRDRMAELEAGAQGDATRRAMFNLHLLEHDDPAQAARFSPSDDQIKVFLTYASGLAAPPSDVHWIKLGEWYQSKALDAESRAGRANALARAVRYYQRFLDEHKRDDVYTTKVKLLLQQVEPMAANLGVIGADGQWMDLLKLADADKDSWHGVWSDGGGRVAVERTAAARLILPVAPEGDYEVKAIFSRTSGKGPIALHLPVGDRSVMLLLGREPDDRYALADVDGTPLVSSRGGVYLGSRYWLEVSVTQPGASGKASVSAKLNAQRILTWEGTVDQLLSPAPWLLPSQAMFAVGSDGASAQFHRVQARMLTGKARLPRVATPASLVSLDQPADGASDQPEQAIKWYDLFDRVDPHAHIVRGLREDWRFEDGELVARRRDKGRITLPTAPVGDYAVNIEFSCISHCEGVNVILPLGQTGAMVTLNGWGGYISGIEAIDGKRAQENGNPTKKKVDPLAKNKRYTLDITVTRSGQGGEQQATIDVRLDDEPYLKWTGPLARLTVPADYQMPYRESLGLGAHESRMIFHTARLRMLDNGLIRKLR